MPTNVVDFLYYVAAWDFDDDWISMCIVCVCLIKSHVIEDNHCKYYTSYYPFFNKL